MKKSVEFVISFACMFVILTLIPYFLEEWAYAIETGKRNANRDWNVTQNGGRIRASQPRSGSDPVKLFAVPTSSERGPESKS